MKTYNYVVGYDSYEEAPQTQLTNEKEYTQEQFDDLVSDCFARAFKAKGKIKHDFQANVDHLIDDAIKILEEEFGFERPAVQATFSPFGWASVVDDKDWEGHVDSDKQLQLIRSKIKLWKKKKN